VFEFVADRYGAAVADLVDDQRLCALGPGQPQLAFRQPLARLTPQRLVEPRPLIDPPSALGCISALWLWHDFLDESHQISQQLDDASGRYWHAIMHRREPDFANSKYWFHRVGEHPVFAPLRAAASELARAGPTDAQSAYLVGQTSWDPLRFVDLCASAVRHSAPNERLCRRIARVEWQLHFDDCFRRAVGGSGAEPA